jgi:predicted dehydrogenase
VAEARPTRDTHDRAVRWRIVGTGGIAAAFAADLRLDAETGELVAVASRTGRHGLRYPGEEAA